MSDPLIAFLHVPKTAGSSLERILGRQYPSQMVVFKEWRHGRDGIGTSGAEESIAHFTELPAADRARIKIVKGHFHFGLTHSFPADTVYFTLLRDPVERIVSTYYFALRNRANFLHEPVASGKMSLKDFVGSDLTPELSNDQVRRIAGVTHADPIRGNYRTDAEMLCAARQNITDRFPVVGLCERFDESILLLGRAFHWRTPYYSRVNVGENRPPEIPEEVRDIIRERNVPDLALYEFALRRLEAQIAEAGASFQKELCTFQRWNPIVSAATRWKKYMLGRIRALRGGRGE